MSAFPARLRPYTIALCSVAVIVLLCGIAYEPSLQSFAAIGVLGALAIVAEHQRVRLPRGLVISPGFIVAMAAIVVFRDHGPVTGPFIVGGLMGVNVAHRESGSRGWIAFNAANFALATAWQVTLGSLCSSDGGCIDRKSVV